MTSTARRDAVLDFLKVHQNQPVSASAIAAKFGVSRQIIVGDIALLRASGADISATPRGYILQDTLGSGGITKTIACVHDDSLLLEELYTIVDNGGALLNVMVEHPVYGQITGQLHIFSRYDADEFYKQLSTTNAPPLSQLTGGVHLHTITCPSEEIFKRIIKSLKEKKLLFENAN